MNQSRNQNKRNKKKRKKERELEKILRVVSHKWQPHMYICEGTNDFIVNNFDLDMFGVWVKSKGAILWCPIKGFAMSAWKLKRAYFERKGCRPIILLIIVLIRDEESY